MVAERSCWRVIFVILFNNFILNMNDSFPQEVLQPKPFEILRLTEKEFQHHHLLHTVRQVNG
jgi:hypothetical protein